MTLLVIDLGSSSARTLLFDDDARLIEGSARSRRHDFTTNSAGLAIADGPRLRKLVESCIDETLAHPAATSIRAVGMATFAGNWLGLDELGEACTPLYTYTDTRSRSQTPALLEKLSGDAESLSSGDGLFAAPGLSAGAIRGPLRIRRGGREPDPARQLISALTCIAAGSGVICRQACRSPVGQAYSIAPVATGIGSTRAYLIGDNLVELSCRGIGGLRRRASRHG